MAKKHFYAIKNTGEIYRSWAECQTALKKVKAPVFKGFATEAEAKAFLAGKSPTASLPSESIFVDGSFNADKAIVGGAFVLVKDDKSVHEQTIRDDKHTEILRLRNVGGELLATIYALKYALSLGMREVTICHDYQGIASWADGSWQAKQDITKRYAAFVEQVIKKEGLQVQFQKISAHTGVKFNERADQLAKQAAEITS